MLCKCPETLLQSAFLLRQFFVFVRNRLRQMRADVCVLDGQKSFKRVGINETLLAIRLLKAHCDAIGFHMDDLSASKTRVAYAFTHQLHDAFLTFFELLSFLTYTAYESIQIVAHAMVNILLGNPNQNRAVRLNLLA